ncbi:MAG: AraC family transcriptional regulator [Sutterellaceae bacterium]|nr:AraC family transcriptional regulator [Sutterellaceae bacterium]
MEHIASRCTFLENALFFARRVGHNATGIQGLSVVCNSCEEGRSSSVALYAGIILQGRKRTTVQGKTYTYGAGTCAVNCAPLPFETFVEKETADKPFISVVLELDPLILDEIILAHPDVTSKISESKDLKFFFESTPEIKEAFARILDLSRDSKKAGILGPVVKRELHALLLLSEVGPWIRSLYSRGSQSLRIMVAMDILRKRFRESIGVAELAAAVNMSLSTFRRHFSSVAGCTPLQFQKTLKLSEVRRLLTVERKSVSQAALATGYMSTSQLASDYKKHFGLNPHEEVVRFRDKVDQTFSE